MALEQQIREDMENAMRSKESVKVTTLRGLLSAFTYELVAQKRKPTDKLEEKDVIAIIKRAVKQRKDSIEQFRKGNREDLAQKEETELLILQNYLPEAVSKEEIRTVAETKISEMGTDKTKIGQLIGAVMKEFAGNADGNDVKEVILQLLN